MSGIIYLSAMVQRREVVDSRGRRLDLRHSGPQRCFILLEGDLLRTWNSGGILLEHTQALQELQRTSDPIDSFNVRMVQIQRIPENNCICLHFTEGMQRILLIPEKDDNGRIIEAWISVFNRSIRESILLDQYATSVFLHTQSVCDSGNNCGDDAVGDVNQFLFLPHKDAFEDSFSIEYKWPGCVDFQHSNLAVQMKAGWGDSRVVSKRCIFLWRDSKNSVKKPIAIISSVTSFHLLSEIDSTLVIEGQAKYLTNDSQVTPLTERVLIKPLQSIELKRLLLFLRDTFEIILPRPRIYDETPANLDHGPINLQSITISSNEKIKTRPDDINHCSERNNLVKLVKSKPWNQLSWTDLYTFYKLKTDTVPLLSPSDFTLKFKSIGYCLKSSLTQNVLQTQELRNLLAENLDLNSDEIEHSNVLTSLYWHHLEINHYE